MIRYITILGIFFFSISIKAHQVDLSTIMLVEKDNNTWILQVRAPLTAFQQEIKTHYAETPYKSPEEFKEMVLAHLRNNLSVVFNNNQKLLFKKGFVKLGHETNVVFEVENIPINIEDIEIENSAFNDIYKSKSAMIILKEGFNKKRFILDEENNHKMQLKAVGTFFIENSAISVKTGNNLYAVLILFIVFVFAAIFLYKHQKKSFSLN